METKFVMPNVEVTVLANSDPTITSNMGELDTTEN